MPSKTLYAANTVSLALAVVCAGGAVLGCTQEEPAPPITFVAPATTPAFTRVAVVRLAESEPDPDGVELLRVGFAAEGGYVSVHFAGPPRVFQDWWQGSVYVVDERTGIAYEEVPVMPIVGPLFGKPKEEGQEGYCMLTNTGGGIRPGSVVTVVLRNYRREHIVVQ